MNIGKTATKVSIVRFLNTAIGFFAIAYFANKIGADQLGIFFVFQAVLGMLGLPADFGIRGAAEKRISEGESPGRVFTTSILMKSIFLLGTIVILSPFKQYINHYIGRQVFYLLLISLILQEYLSLIERVLNAELRVGETALLSLIKQTSWAVIGYILVQWNMGALGLVYSLIIGFSIALIVGVNRISINLGKPSFLILESLWDYSRHNFLSSITSKANNWLDTLIIGFFLGSSAVGIYEVAWRITNVITLFTKSYAFSSFPQVSNWHSNGNYKKISSFVSNGFSISMLLVIPALFGSALISKEILGIIFGAKYTTASMVLTVLIFGRIFDSLNSVLGGTINGLDRPEIGAKIAVIVLASNTLLNIVLVPQYGIIGGAIATSTAFLIGSITVIFYTSKILSPAYHISQWISIIFSSLIMYIIMEYIQDTMKINTISALLVFLSFSVIIYFSTICICPPTRSLMNDIYDI